MITLANKDIELKDNFFEGLFTKPMVIVAPVDFDFETDTSNDTFEWKGGIFYGYKLQGYVESVTYYDGHFPPYYHSVFTFYYDTLKHIRPTRSYSNYYTFQGEERMHWEDIRKEAANVSLNINTYDLNDCNEKPEWIDETLRLLPYIGELSDIDADYYFSIRFDSSFANCRPKSTYRWFDFEKLTYNWGWGYENELIISYYPGIEGLQYLNTSETTNTEKMFYNMTFMRSIDLSHLDFSKVTQSDYMFGNCHRLTELHVNSTMANLSPYTFMGIGCCEPCVIYAPEDIIFNTQTDNDSFLWKNGTFINPSFDNQTYAYTMVSNDTVTIYYDNKDIDKRGIHFHNIDEDRHRHWYMRDWNLYWTEPIKYLVLDKTLLQMTPQDTRYRFSKLDQLEAIQGIENLRSTNMKGLFSGCCKLTSIDLGESDMTFTANNDYMFDGCSSLSSVILPQTCSIIGECAFRGCTNLATITIPSSVKVIGDAAFDGCASLEKVYMGNSIPVEITSSTFPYRHNALLYVPKGSKQAYKNANYWKEFKEIVEYDNIIDFADAKTKSFCIANWDADGDGELSINEADAVTSLGTVFKKSSISSFNELKYFTGLTSIGEGAFSGSTVKEITLPKQITSLEKDAFLNCKSLVSLHLPANVSSIEQNALSGCTAMTSITVDDANTAFCSIDGVLFSKDKTLLVQFPAAKTSEYAVPEGTTTIGRDAFYLSSLESVTLPSTLKELIYDAFGYSRKLMEMELPEGVETIGDYAFDNCTVLKKLWIPASVSSISQRMCNGCKAITDVYSANDNPFGINDNNFNAAVYANATLHVPAGVKEKYAALGGWKNFANIVSAEGASCDETQIFAGSTAEISIGLTLDDNEKYNGFQFDLYLPTGITLAKKGNAFLYELSDRYTGDMMASFNDFGDGHYRVVVFSLSNALITDTEGEVIRLTLFADDNVVSGEYEGEITDFKLSDENGNSIPVLGCKLDIVVSEFVMGDVNHDRQVDVADVMMAVNKALGKNIANFHQKEADINGDDIIDVADVMSIVRIVLNSGSSSAPQNHRVNGNGSMTSTTTSDGYTLSLYNSEAYTALQMVITLPSGSSLKDVLLNGNPSHQTSFQRLEGSNTHGNQYKVVVWSADGTALYKTDKFLQLQTSGSKGDITISDIQLTNEEFETIVLPDASSTTSIDITTIQPSKESFYNLQGMKVKHPLFDVYIYNGKKTIKK